MSCPGPPRCPECIDTGVAGRWDAMAGHYWAFCSCPAGVREEQDQNQQSHYTSNINTGTIPCGTSPPATTPTSFPPEVDT